MNRFRIHPLVLAGLITLATTAPALAAPVEGQFKLDDLVVAPTEAAAFRMRDSFAPREFETYVMLTNTAVDIATISASTDPYSLAINDDAADTDHLTFSVDKTGKVTMNAKVGGTQYIDTTGKIMGQQGGLVAECSHNTTTRVACSVKSAEPVSTDDGAWSLDVSFDTVVHGRTPGKPIAKDGGDAGKALAALAKAITGDDLTVILTLVTPEIGADFQRDYNTAEENLKWAKELLSVRLPKKAKVTGGEQAAPDQVLLEVEGQPWENGKMLYTVTMQQIDGKWVYADTATHGMLKD